MYSSTLKILKLSSIYLWLIRVLRLFILWLSCGKMRQHNVYDEGVNIFIKIVAKFPCSKWFRFISCMLRSHYIYDVRSCQQYLSDILLTAISLKQIWATKLNISVGNVKENLSSIFFVIHRYELHLGCHIEYIEGTDWLIK